MIPLTNLSKVEQYYATMPISIERALARKEALLARARQAASWGVPDNESTGYSQSELCGIIRQLINCIEKS